MYDYTFGNEKINPNELYHPGYKLEPAKISVVSYKHVLSYGVNTHPGYNFLSNNLDRVCIINNIPPPNNYKIDQY